MRLYANKLSGGRETGRGKGEWVENCRARLVSGLSRVRPKMHFHLAARGVAHNRFGVEHQRMAQGKRKSEFGALSEWDFVFRRRVGISGRNAETQLMQSQSWTECDFEIGLCLSCWLREKRAGKVKRERERERWREGGRARDRRDKVKSFESDYLSARPRAATGGGAAAAVAAS